MNARLPLVALVAANALPLVGVLAWGWRLDEVLLLYWSENVVVGTYTLLKLRTFEGPEADHLRRFFPMHFGAFMVAHLVLLLVFYVRVDGVADAATLAGRVLVGTLVLYASHGVSFVVNFLRGPERRTASLLRVFLAPYPRLVAMHVAVIVAASFARAGLVALAFLVVLKTAIDVGAHLLERVLSRARSTFARGPIVLDLRGSRRGP